MREHLAVHDFWLVALPGWLTGVGTLGLAAVTFWLARREGSDRRRLQSAEEDRIMAERRAQAGSVTAWFAGQVNVPVGPPQSRVAITNRSDEPVYNVVVFLVFVQGAAPDTGEAAMATFEDHVWDYVRVLSVLPPGAWEILTVGDWGGMQRFPGAETGFTDKSGTHWIRRANGSLEEIATDAVSYYGLNYPLLYSEPQMPGSAP
jgi:hypothetical protein